MFNLFPNSIKFGNIHIFYIFVLFYNHFFYFIKPTNELIGCIIKSSFRINVYLPAKWSDRKQKVSHFLVYVILVVVIYSTFKLRYLLMQFLYNRFLIWKIKARCFFALISAGNWRGIAFNLSVTVVRCFSSLLSFSQFRNTSSEVSALTSPKTWGCLKIIFLHISSVTSSILNWFSSAEIPAWNTIWSNTSPNSSRKSSGATTFTAQHSYNIHEVIKWVSFFIEHPSFFGIHILVLLFNFSKKIFFNFISKRQHLKVIKRYGFYHKWYNNVSDNGYR